MAGAAAVGRFWADTLGAGAPKSVRPGRPTVVTTFDGPPMQYRKSETRLGVAAPTGDQDRQMKRCAVDPGNHVLHPGAVTDDVPALVERVWRAEAASMLGALSRRLGDFDLAEEALAEAATE